MTGEANLYAGNPPAIHVIDNIVKIQKRASSVIPAKAG
jgi:hypothetical protein